MEVVLIYVALALAVGAFSRSRGHSFIAGFFFSLLLSPLIAALIIAVRATNAAKLESRKIASGSLRKCPACAELVRKDALKCRYCGEVLPPLAAAPDEGAAKGW